MDMGLYERVQIDTATTKMRRLGSSSPVAVTSVPMPAVIADRFELAHCLGQGGMSVVYAAHDRVLERPVAIKFLRPELARDAVCAERMRREALAMASVHSRNVVAIYDLGAWNGGQYIVMQQVGGHTLEEETKTY